MVGPHLFNLFGGAVLLFVAQAVSIEAVGSCLNQRGSLTSAGARDCLTGDLVDLHEILTVDRYTGDRIRSRHIGN